MVKVLREGQWKEIESKELLPGDVVRLERCAGCACPLFVFLLCFCIFALNQRC